MKPSSTNRRDDGPIAGRPVEWDFRWVESEEEAGHVYLLELTREVIRQAETQLNKPREKKALLALVEAMALSVDGLSSRNGLSVVQRLEKAQFMVGVMATYATGMGEPVSRLPTAFDRMKTLRSILSQPREAVVGITKLTTSKSFRLFSFSGETSHLLRIPKGATAKMAKDDFAVWADANLPSGNVPLGGRPDLHIVKLLRLAYYRFDQACEHPRPHAGFAVAVRANANGNMSPAFTEFGNCCYAPFMSLLVGQPKSSTWTEYVSAAKAELEPLVAEVLAAAKSFV